MTKNIKDLLNHFIDSENDWKIKLFKDWPNIIGNLNNQVKIEKIEGNTLILGVYSSSWMQELYLLSNILLKKINESIGKPKIKRIVFKQTQKPVIIKKTFVKKRTYKKVILTNKEIQTLEKIKDPELKLELKNFLIKCYRNHQ